MAVPSCTWTYAPKATFAPTRTRSPKSSPGASAGLNSPATPIARRPSRPSPDHAVTAFMLGIVLASPSNRLSGDVLSTRPFAVCRAERWAPRHRVRSAAARTLTCHRPAQRNRPQPFITLQSKRTTDPPACAFPPERTGSFAAPARLSLRAGRRYASVSIELYLLRDGCWSSGAPSEHHEEEADMTGGSP